MGFCLLLMGITLKGKLALSKPWMAHVSSWDWAKFPR